MWLEDFGTEGLCFGGKEQGMYIIRGFSAVLCCDFLNFDQGACVLPNRDTRALGQFFWLWDRCK